MVVYECQPAVGPLDGDVRVPGSKSITNRALVAAAMADGTSLITNVLLAEDTRIMIDALCELGVPITVDEEDAIAEVTGCCGLLPASDADIFCGNAGTVMRFLPAVLATGNGVYRFDGAERMRQRPISPLLDVIHALGSGVDFEQEPGYPPFTLHANGVSGGQIALTDIESSQFVSALLLAAPYARRDLLIDVSGSIPSVPYLRLTLDVMQRFNVAVVDQFGPNEAKFIVPAPQRYQAGTVEVEPDASSASYFLAAAAIAGGRVAVHGLGTQSQQGDARFVDVLEQMGCRVERAANLLAVTGPTYPDRLIGVDVDLCNMPDVALTLAVVALHAGTPTTIRNVGNLRIKETDRLRALANETSKLGAVVKESEDSLFH